MGLLKGEVGLIRHEREGGGGLQGLGLIVLPDQVYDDVSVTDGLVDTLLVPGAVLRVPAPALEGGRVGGGLDEC